MNHDQLIEGYAPRFSDKERASIIQPLVKPGGSSWEMTDVQRLALFEHSIECTLRTYKNRKSPKEEVFLTTIGMLADLRAWHKLNGILPECGS